MRRIIFTALFIAFISCRGERPPRDYQNAPPAMTHPPHTATQTPAAHGMPQAAPEPSSGAEGINVTRQPAKPNPPTTTVKDQAPATTRT